MPEGQCEVVPDPICHICGEGTTVSCALGTYGKSGKRFVVEYCKDCAWPEHIRECGFVPVDEATKWLQYR